ncbi:hypothetical protein [Paraburkholderia domus]|jgi:hypothetical protein|uniref:Uncharacterized protein n=1 Tax=Paraburkholderia domus TaxID=2793075 RepID=A0A9N8N6F5_9BURK|nr:hypothetical protein [Paraburkholderia domus]MBK5162753.1 hypothetical protein [Burkholderia sp. R-70211]CAE6958528.1 hypothetical protein R70211_06762 [Paraburkholderia domus]
MNVHIALGEEHPARVVVDGDTINDHTLDAGTEGDFDVQRKIEVLLLDIDSDPV